MIYYAMMYEVVFLDPVVQFLNGIDVKMRAKAMRTIELLKRFGPELPLPHSKRLVGYPIHELRVRRGTDIIRMFYFSAGARLYVVTTGYVKKTDRTNRREIERAMRVRQQYLEEERK
jgi:phage-related protein